MGKEGFKTVKADISKKVLVIGGGQSGMVTALYAAQRGHNVTLVEYSSRLPFFFSSKLNNGLHMSRMRKHFNRLYFTNIKSIFNKIFENSC
nr:FAD/NAD(P)-binding oxidoreductase [Vallitalea okinawensis]